MMTLPNFEEPHPSIEMLRAEQGRLQSQTDKLVSTTGVLGIFSKYGDVPPIGGSYEYGLMVYPDMDISLISQDINKQSFAGLVGELVANQYVRKTATADTVDFAAVHKGRPKGYWIGLEVPFDGDRWGIDCWVQRPEWVSGNEDTYAGRLKQLDQSGKDAVLMIKYDLIRTGLYGKKVFSADVYDAVLDKGVRSLDEFNTTLKG